MSGRTRDSLVCCGCSCLCDDIDVVVEEQRVMETTNACRWGAARFLGLKKFSSSLPRARCETHRRRRGGRQWHPISLAEALAECREHLFHAQRVAIYGLGQLSTESLWLLMEGLWDWNTLWIPSDGPLLKAYVETYRRRTPPLTTLECVRNHADFVLFWGANPLRSSPRLLARYALFPRGKFTERGAEDRAAWTVDVHVTEMSRATHLLTISTEVEKECIRALHRATTTGTLESPPELNAKRLAPLLKDLEKSRYRVFFFGRGPLYHESGPEIMDALAAWVEDLGSSAPTFLMPLPCDFNSMGFLEAFTAAGGLGNSRWHLHGDLHDWSPRQGDLLLAVSGDCFWFLTDEQKHAVRKNHVPVVALSAYETMTTAEADLVISVGLQGLDASGAAVRLDGVSLHVKKLWDRNVVCDAAVIRDLFEPRP